MKIERIVYINQTLGMGGAEQFGADLLAGFQKRGISVIAYLTNQEYQHVLQSRGIQTHHIPVITDIIGNWRGLLKAVWFFPKAWRHYYQITKQLKPNDLVLLSGYPEKILVTWLLRHSSHHIVWIEYGPLSTIFQKFAKLPYWLYRAVTNRPSLIIVPSENTKHDMVKNIPHLREKMMVIPCGRPAPQQYASTVTPNQICCVSRMEAGKGQDLLVKAFARVHQEFPEATLVFVGQGDFDQEVKTVVKRLKLEKSVSFLGRVPDPLAIMAASHVCVFPSVWALEGFGLVTIEAMSLCKPVVAFNTGPTPEIIEDGSSGLLAQSGNVNDLAQQITKIFHDQKLAMSLGKHARHRFEKHYTIDRIVERYLEAFQRHLS